MHQSVMSFVRAALAPDYIKGRSVLEVGSYNVNGTVRDILQPHAGRYIGVDMRPGPGVDVVSTAEEMPDSLKSEIVVSCEMLEHAFEWRKAFTRMADLCTGVLLVTARGPGFPLHDYPSDHWRFTPADIEQVCKALGLRVCVCCPDPQAPGFFLVADCTNRGPLDESAWPTPMSMAGVAKMRRR